MQSASEKKSVSGERSLAMEVVTAPHEIQVDEPMDLLTASFDSSRSLERQTWILSAIRILQDQSRVNGKFRVLICQGEKLLREITGNVQYTSLVLILISMRSCIASRFKASLLRFGLDRVTKTVNYLSQQTRELLVRMPHIYSSRYCWFTTDLTVFASCFTTDNFEAYFP
jgi:hypothetical protein